jgi:hypothetical protein
MAGEEGLDAEERGFLWGERLQEILERRVFVGFDGLLDFLKHSQALFFGIEEIGRLRGIVAEVVDLLQGCVGL